MGNSPEDTGAESTALTQLGPMGRVIMGYDPPAPLDPELISGRIRERVLTAQTPEEMFEAGKALSFDDVLGVPLEVKGAHLLPSRIKEDGPKVFMVVDAVRLDTGAEIVLTTSGGNIMEAIAVASDRGWQPFRFKVERSEHETTAGYRPYVVRSV